MVLHMQEVRPRLHNLHSLLVSQSAINHIHTLPFDALAQCPALRVLELADPVRLTSPGTCEEVSKGLRRATWTCSYSIVLKHCIAWWAPKAGALVHPKLQFLRLIGRHPV